MYKWWNKFSILLVVFLGLCAPPCEAKENHAGTYLISMEVENQPLRSVLKRISESVDHEITVSENWANMALTVRLDSVNLEKALRQIIVALGKPSHVILTDNSKRKTEILICAEGPGRIEKGKEARVKHLRKEATSKDAETAPPEEGMTQSERNPTLSKGKWVDMRNVEVVPPEKPGERGIAQEELEIILKKNQAVDPKNVEVVPPDKPGEKGITLGELEKMLKQRKNPDSDTESTEALPPGEDEEQSVSEPQTKKVFNR